MSGDWTFLSNHGHVLVCLARDPDARTRDVAQAVGITERAIQHIVRDLVEQGYLRKEKVGRRNRYEVVRHARFRHELEAHVTLGGFLGLVVDGEVAVGRRRDPRDRVNQADLEAVGRSPGRLEARRPTSTARAVADARSYS